MINLIKFLFYLLVQNKDDIYIFSVDQVLLQKAYTCFSFTAVAVLLVNPELSLLIVFS